MATIRRAGVVVCAAAVLGWGVQSARAGSVDLCSGAAGWRASWDPSLDGLVQILDADCSQVSLGRVFIEKAATFTQGPGPGGVFPSVVVTFLQTSNTNVNRLIIEDEIITNLTGQPWTDFHMELVGGAASFNVAATATSGGTGPIGFSVAPFTTAVFSNSDTRLDIAGGVVGDSSVWTPGGGATNGELHINVTPNILPGQPATFVLVETPTPEPGSLALLALGAAAVLRRVR